MAEYYDAVTSGSTKTPPRIQAAPVAKVTYDQPRVSTTSGATGIATPYAGNNPTPITAPSYLSGGAIGAWYTGAGA